MSVLIAFALAALTAAVVLVDAKPWQRPPYLNPSNSDDINQPRRDQPNQ